MNRGIVLSKDQADAVMQINAFNDPGKAIIITGAAGTGKSTVIEHLMENYSCNYEMCATTGKAALNIGARTIDSFFCFSRHNWSLRDYDFLKKIMRDSAKKIIIDESSMIGEEMGNLLLEIAIEFGLTLFLFGDWAQASPVKDGPSHKSELFDGIKVISLTESHRQQHGGYLDALNKIRFGEVTPEVEKVFKACVGTDDPNALRMFATNRAADSCNQKKLMDHSNNSSVPTINLCTQYKDVRRNKKFQLKDVDINRSLSRCSLAHNEPIAIGCRVVITCNAKFDFRTKTTEYVNGDTGVLTNIVFRENKSKNIYNYTDLKVSELEAKDFENKYSVLRLHILLDRTNEIISVSEHEQNELDSLNREKLNFKGFPVRLGYAATIHKTQGMTLNSVVMDMKSIRAMPLESRHGLAYIGLSRTRTIEGLHLDSWDPGVVYCSEDIKPFL